MRTGEPGGTLLNHRSVENGANKDVETVIA